MVLHGRYLDAEDLTDLLVRQPFGDEVEDLPLTARQRRSRFVRPRCSQRRDAPEQDRRHLRRAEALTRIRTRSTSRHRGTSASRVTQAATPASARAMRSSLGLGRGESDDSHSGDSGHRSRDRRDTLLCGDSSGTRIRTEVPVFCDSPRNESEVAPTTRMRLTIELLHETVAVNADVRDGENSARVRPVRPRSLESQTASRVTRPRRVLPRRNRRLHSPTPSFSRYTNCHRDGLIHPPGALRRWLTEDGHSLLGWCALAVGARARPPGPGSI